MKPPAFAATILRARGLINAALAKILSTNIAIQFTRNLGSWRFDVSGRAHVYCAARIRVALHRNRRPRTDLFLSGYVTADAWPARPSPIPYPRGQGRALTRGDSSARYQHPPPAGLRYGSAPNPWHDLGGPCGWRFNTPCRGVENP
jgi:hypothetical protein